jgi:hypothetical protein
MKKLTIDGERQRDRLKGIDRDNEMQRWRDRSMVRLGNKYEEADERWREEKKKRRR